MLDPNMEPKVRATWCKLCIYGLVFRVPTPHPPNGMGPQVAPPSLYLQAIGSISAVHPRICSVLVFAAFLTTATF